MASIGAKEHFPVYLPELGIHWVYCERCHRAWRPDRPAQKYRLERAVTLAQGEADYQTDGTTRTPEPTVTFTVTYAALVAKGWDAGPEVDDREPESVELAAALAAGRRGARSIRLTVSRRTAAWMQAAFEAHGEGYLVGAEGAETRAYGRAMVAAGRQIARALEGVPTRSAAA